MRRTKLATPSKDFAGLGTGDKIPTGSPTSSLTILIGSTKSVSFVITAATSNAFVRESLIKWLARFTSDPFSSEIDAFTNSGAVFGAFTLTHLSLTKVTSENCNLWKGFQGI